MIVSSLFSVNTMAVSDDSDIERYLQPPYQETAFALQPNIVDINKIPKLQPGDVVSFYLTQRGDLKQSFCDEQFQIPVIQPVEYIDINYYHGLGGLFKQSDLIELQHFSDKSGIHFQTAQLVLKQISMRDSLVISQARGTIKSMKKEVTIKASIVDSKTKVSENSTNAHSAQDKKQVKSLADSSGDNSESSRLNVHSKAYSNNMSPISLNAFYQYMRRSNNMSPVSLNKFYQYIKKEQFFNALIDEDLASFINEFGDKTGFSESDNIDSKEYSEEQKAMMEDFGNASGSLDDEDTNITEFLGGLLSSKFRRESVIYPADTVYNAKFNCSVAPNEIYHGSHVLLSYEIKNTGDAPLYDFMLMNNIPKYMDFITGPEQHSGYTVLPIKSRNAYVIKLFRPLKVAETFKTYVVFKMKPWYIKG